MLTLFMGGPIQPLDNNGNIVVGGKLNFYEAGSALVRQDTYADHLGTVPNANPVVLDGNGRAYIYLAVSPAYDIVFTDPDDVTIWTATYVIANAPAS